MSENELIPSVDAESEEELEEKDEHLMESVDSVSPPKKIRVVLKKPVG